MKFGLSWGKMAVTHFVTQFTQVLRHFGVYSSKQKQLFRETVFKFGLILVKKMVSVSTKLILEKSAKTKKN